MLRSTSSSQDKFSRVIYVFIALIIIISISIPPDQRAIAQGTYPETPPPTTTCYTLDLVVADGQGSLVTDSPQNCDGGYLEGSQVNLTATPAEGYSLVFWKFTDNDGRLENTNQITIRANQVVNVYFSTQPADLLKFEISQADQPLDLAISQDLQPLASVNLISEPFSSGYPGLWTIGHDSGGGSYAWAWSSTYPYAHAYASSAGYTYYYPDNLHVYMDRRGLSLSGYNTASLTFNYIVDTEPNADIFTVNLRDQSGIWHELFRKSGTSALTWSSQTINLDAYAGQTNLYIQFRFDSDASISGSPYEGVYLDNVILSADVKKPDLSISASAVNDTIIFPRDTLTASGTEYNGGTLAAGAHYLYYYLSSNNTLDSGDANFANDLIPSLAIGGSSAQTATYTVPDLDRAVAANFGTRYVIFKADGSGSMATGVIDESNEANNTSPVTINIARPTVAGGSINTYSTEAPTRLTATFNICNPDNQTRTIGLGFSIRKSGTTTWIDDANDDVPKTVSAGCGNYVRYFDVPTGTTPGTYDLAFGLHSGLPGTGTYLYDFVETFSVLTIQTPKPDLSISASSVNDTILFPRDTLTASGTEYNGGTAAAGAHYLYYYLSSNNTLDSGDENFGNDFIASLAVGGSSPQSAPYIVPDLDRAIPANFGTRYVIFKADGSGSMASGVIDEKNETNNTAPVTITIARPTVASGSINTYSTEAPVRLSATFNICNPDNQTRTIGLGFSIRKSGTITWIDDANDDVTKTVSTGCANYVRYFDVQAGTTPGVYDIAFGLHSGLPGTSTYLYDYIENLSVLTILAPKPDLSISASSVNDAIVFPRDILTASGTEYNGGTATAGGHYLYYYLSSNNTLDSGDENFGNDYIASLAVGGSSPQSAPYTVPDLDRTIPANFGTRYVIFKADGSGSMASGVIDEKNETNNTAPVTITIARPTVASGSINTYSTEAPVRLSATFNICNPDNQTRTIGLGFSIRKSGTITWIDDANDDVTKTVSTGCANYVRYFDVQAGTTPGVYDIAFGLHSGLPGTSTYLYDYIENLSVLTILAPKPDLVISSSSVNDTILFPKDSLTAAATEANNGSLAAGSHYLYYYLSTDNTLDGGDVNFANDYIASLAIGGSSPQSAPYIVPELDRGVPTNFGTRYVIFKADGSGSMATGVIDEKNETNNTSTASITITRPTLTTSIQPVNAELVRRLTVTFHICNPDNQIRTIGLGFSIRKSGSTTWIDDSNDDVTKAVAAGCGDYVRYFDIPPATTPGVYDTGYALHNTLPGPSTYMYDYGESLGALTITAPKPDLSLSTATVNDTIVFPRDTLTASGTEYNGGTAAAGAHYLYYYLSGDNLVDVGDNNFANDYIPALAINASSPQSAPYTVPDLDRSVTANFGARYLIFKADGSGANTSGVIDEKDETNNVSSVAITIARPNLAQGSLNTYSAKPSSRLAVTVNICNPDNQVRTIGLGFSIRKTGTIPWDNDVNDDLTKTVAPGCADYIRYFDIPANTTAGTYDIAFGLHSGLPGSSTYLYDYLEKTGVLNVILPLDMLAFTTTETNPSLGIGDTLNTRFQINNPNSINQDIYLLVRARSPAGAYTFLKDTSSTVYIKKTVAPGTSWFDWPVQIHDGAPNGGGYSLTGFISTTSSWADYVESLDKANAFTVISPLPELSIKLSDTPTTSVKWRTINYRKTSTEAWKAYDIWAVIDNGNTIPSGTSLTQYARSHKIYALYVMEPATNTRLPESQATPLVLDVENRLLLENDPITPAIPLAYQAQSIASRPDNTGKYYQYGKSLVTSTVPEFLLYSGAKGLNVPEARRLIYKTILLELILNQELTKNDMMEQLAQFLEVRSRGYEMYGKIIEAGQTTNSASDPNFKAIEQIEIELNEGIMKKNFEEASNILSAVKAGLKVGSEVYEAIMLQALVNTQAEERIVALKLVINSNSLPQQDYLLTLALADAEAEYLQLKTTHYQAFLSAATNGSMLQNLDNFKFYVQKFVYPLIKKDLSTTVNQFLLNHPSLKTFLKKGQPYAFALSVMWDNFVALDGRLHLLRQADSIIVLQNQMETYLYNHRVFSSSIDHLETYNLLMLNDMRQYLGFLHFRRLGQTLDGKLEDVFMLDVIGGLLGFYQAFYPSYTEARLDYTAQENRALKYYDGLAAPYFFLNANDRFSPLVVALGKEYTANIIPMPDVLSINANSGKDINLNYLLKNSGQRAGVYFISVSVDSGISITTPATSNTIWTRYEIGTPIYYKDGAPNPRPSNKLLYESSGTLLPGAQVEVSLTLRKTTPGIFKIYTRAAMRASNAPGLDVNFVRTPLSSSTTDQQGWPATVMTLSQPVPSVTANVSSLQIEVGSLQVVNFDLENTGGRASPAYIDVSVSSELEIVGTLPLFAWDCYKPGEDIYHNGSSNPSPAEFMLCSSVQSEMGTEKRSFSVIVRSLSLQNKDSQWIKYRAAMNPADGPETTNPDSFIRYPTSEPPDQQGWSAFTIPVTIWENHPPVISSFSPNQVAISMLAGQSTTFSVVAQDQDVQSNLAYLWLLDYFTPLGMDPSVTWLATQAQVGEHTISVIISDGVLFISQQWTVTVLPPSNITTTTTITSHVPNPSLANQDYPVAVHVSATNGTPGGSVMISDGSSSCQANLVNGVGNCNIKPLASGITTLSASYPGDATFNPSSATVNHTVNKQATNTTIFSHLPDPSLVGQGYEVQVSVNATSGQPTGVARVSDGTASCDAAISGGTGFCNLVSTDAGQKTLSANFLGNEMYAASTGSIAHTVNPLPATATFYFADGDVTIAETAGPLVVRLVMSSPAVGNEQVTVSAVPGSANAADYTYVNGAVVFSTPGQTYMDIVIPIINDTIQEGDESFSLALSNPGNSLIGLPATMVVHILDDDVVPANDDFNSALELLSFPANISINVSSATTAMDDPQQSCASGSQKGQSVWYSFITPGYQTLAFDSTGSNYETAFSIWKGERGSLASEYCTNQDPFNFNTVPGTRYYLEVTNWNSAGAPPQMLQLAISDITMDVTPPVIKSMSRLDATPSSQASVRFYITFSENVNGVDLFDFSLVTSGLIGAQVAGVKGSGKAYEVTVLTGSGSGSLGLDVSDFATITDAVGNWLGNLPYQSGINYTIDKTPPQVVSINRISAAVINAPSVSFRVNFSEAVSGVSVDDFSLAGTSLVGAKINSVTGSGAIYTVSVNTGTGSGNLRLDIPLGATANDLADNLLAGLPYTTGQAYTLDRIPPRVTAISLLDVNPSTATSLRFNVIFSEAVSGVGMQDFRLVRNGLAGTPTITAVSGSASAYVVTVSTGSGVGTLKLNVFDDDSIRDAAQNPLGGTGAGNGGVTNGPWYTLDRNNSISSGALLDGWVLESRAASRTGGSAQATGNLLVGDDSGNRQYKAIISFNTATLPDNALITKVTITIKRAGITGTNPFTTHGLLVADIQKGFLGTTKSLETIDFQSPALRSAIGSFTLVAGKTDLYQLILSPNYHSAINLVGLTQLRLRFGKPTNNDSGADYLQFFAGDSLNAAYRPTIVVEYTLP